MDGKKIPPLQMETSIWQGGARILQRCQPYLNLLLEGGLLVPPVELPSLPDLHQLISDFENLKSEILAREQQLRYNTDTVAQWMRKNERQSVGPGTGSTPGPTPAPSTPVISQPPAVVPAESSQQVTGSKIDKKSKHHHKLKSKEEGIVKHEAEKHVLSFTYNQSRKKKRKRDKELESELPDDKGSVILRRTTENENVKIEVTQNGKLKLKIPATSPPPPATNSVPLPIAANHIKGVPPRSGTPKIPKPPKGAKGSAGEKMKVKPRKRGKGDTADDFPVVVGEERKEEQPQVMEGDYSKIQGDEATPFVVPLLGRHYIDQWAEEDGAMLPGSEGKPVREVEEIDETIHSGEVVLGSLTERVVSALQEEGSQIMNADFEGASDTVESRPPRSITEMMLLEDRLKSEIKHLGLLPDEEVDPEPKEEDEVVTELRKLQQELRLVIMENTKRKQRLKEIACYHRGWEQYNMVLDALSKQIETDFVKRFNDADMNWAQLPPNDNRDDAVAETKKWSIPASPPDPVLDWLAGYAHNSFIIPPVATTRRAPLSPVATATAETPGRAVQSQLLAPPSFRFPYSLCFKKISSLPLNQLVSDEYMRSDRLLRLRLQVSLFDLETNSFFGRTWVDPLEYDLRNLPEDHLQWEEAADADYEVTTRSLGGKRREESESTLDDEREEEDEDEEDSDEDYDDSGTDESGSEEEESDDHSVEEEAPPKRTRAASLSSHDPERERIRTRSLKSQKKQTTTEKKGKNTDKGKLKRKVSTPGESLDFDSGDSLPIYLGSPRALLFIGSFLKENLGGYPILVPIPTANITFAFGPRPDLRLVTMLWQENVWISAEDELPGRKQFDMDEDGMVLYRGLKARLSNIIVSVFPSVRKFEEIALNEYVEKFNDTFPETLAKLPDGRLAPAEIVERRLHVGFHNTQVFLSPPVVITLQPTYDDLIGGDAFHLTFNGGIDLDKYLPDDPGIAVVFVMDYRVALKVNQDVAKKATGLAALMQKLHIGGSSKNPQTPNVVDVERVVTVGCERSHTKQQHQPKAQTPVIAERSMTPRGMELPIEEEYDEPEEEQTALDESHHEIEPMPPQLHSQVNDSSGTIHEENEEEEEIVPEIVTPKPTYSEPPTKKNNIDNITRTEKARIARAGFITYKDFKGEKPFSVNAAGREKANVRTNFLLERSDSLHINEVTIEIMAVNCKTDPTVIINAQRSNLPPFIFYLGFHALDIDVWDADSFLYQGSARLELRHCLRQGQGGVVAEYDVDIVLNEDSQFSSSYNNGEGGERIAKLIGRLHARIVNIGKESASGAALHPTARFHPFDKSSVIVRDFRSLSSSRGEIVVEPKRMIETDTELYDILRMNAEDRRLKVVQESISTSGDAASGAEKLLMLQKIERVRNFLDRATKGTINGEYAFNYHTSRKDKQRDLETINVFRERKRPLVIEQALLNSMTTVHTIPASLGQANYFEYAFKNPYDEEHLFEISWMDNELRVVVDSNEWKYLRRMYGIQAGVEDSLFSLSQDGTPSVLLGPGEEVAVPFIFQSTVEPDVSILNQRRTPVALLNLCVSMVDFVVDRAFRFFRPESETLRITLRAPIVDTDNVSNEVELNPIFEASAPLNRYIRCSTPDVVCVADEKAKGSKIKTVMLKWKARSAMDVQTTYILIYYDPFFTALSEIWQVQVHALNSDPDEILVTPPGPFNLLANVLNEIPIGLRPRQMRDKTYILNFCGTFPSITKSFDITVPRGRAVNKVILSTPLPANTHQRVSYTNPYAARKVFFLQSNAEDILQFREGRVLELDAGETKYIPFRFLPIHGNAPREVLVFLNDEEDRIEECLRIGIRCI
ncbi:Nephrocystin-4 [Phlyctochytrium bullatum]|nr:Nephrocystin-4 [Phlyctochytrium bullatum]